MKNKILTGILGVMMLTSSGGFATMYIKAEEMEAVIKEQEVDSIKKSTEIANLKETVENKDFDLKANKLVIKGQLAKIKALNVENKDLKSENKKLKTENEKLKNEIIKLKKSSSSSTSSKVQSNSGGQSVKGTMTVNASAYTAFCEGCNGTTKSGYNVSNTIYYQGMRIIASDLSVLPMYSIVKIEGFSEKFIVLDIGGAIKGNKIDILFKSKSEAYKFGRKNLKLEVIRYGK